MSIVFLVGCIISASMHIPKEGLRALGIAESFSGRDYSTLSGVVMRKDLRVDGFAFACITVGGMDATGGLCQSCTRLTAATLT